MKASSLPMFTLWSISWDWPVLSNWIKISAQGNYRWSWHGLSSGHTSSPKITCQIKKIIKKKNYCSYCHWLFWLSFCSAENIFKYYIFKNKQVKIEKKTIFSTLPLDSCLHISIEIPVLHLTVRRLKISISLKKK